MEYILGLDIGTTSIGWAVLNCGLDGDPVQIYDLGVRMFDAAENPKDGSSLAAPRRAARSARRITRRRWHRKERIRELMIQSGLITKERLAELFLDSGFEKDVYTLRAEGLDRLLNNEEWVRVLMHLTQRRGYHSGSTAAAAQDKDDGVLKAAIRENEKLMSQKGYRTIGEMFCKDLKFTITNPDGSVVRKTRNTSDSYTFTVTREMVAQEVRLLWLAQRKFGSAFASEELEERYSAILFGQRSFDEGPGGQSPYRKMDLRGKCTFEPTELRAYKACYTFEYFKLLQDLNHIRLRSASQDARRLSPDEREKIIQLAHKSPDLNYARLRTAISLPESWTFNSVHYDAKGQVENEKKTKFPEMQSYHEIRKALDKLGKNTISTLAPEELDQIGEILSRYKSDDRRREELLSAGIAEPMVSAMMSLSFSKVGNLSLTAMRKLIPHLEAGMNYDEACRAVYADHRGLTKGSRRQYLSFGELLNAGELDDITSPVVLRAISQTCKVVNAVIRKYGSPRKINLELAREMQQNFADRKRAEKSMEDNRAANDRIRVHAEEVKGSKANGQDIVKFKLFQEQDGICLYSGQKIVADRLFEPGYAEVDHIIPYSISFDDSYRNKVLVLASENRQKGNRLPLEYLAEDPAKKDAYLTRVETIVKDYRKREKLLKQSLSEKEAETLKSRHLVDTQFIARAMLRILSDHLEYSHAPIKKRVTAVSGAATAYIRKRLGLEKNRDDGDLHHAMDAVVIATVTDGVIQRITRYAQRREWNQKYTDHYLDPETGELMTKDAFDEKYAPEFPEPWPEFRRELEARLDPLAPEAIEKLNLATYADMPPVRPVFVSRMPRRKVHGQAHEETIRSGREPGYSVSRVSLTELKLQDGTIQDYYHPGDDRLLYEALLARLKEFGGDAKKAFAEPFHKPKRDGTPGPLVKKVPIIKRCTLPVNVGRGIANNPTGSMIRVDVFWVEGEGYYLVPIYVSNTINGELPQKAVTRDKPYEEWKIMRDEDFLFSLHKNDLIRIVSKKGTTLKLTKGASGQSEVTRNEWMLYYKGLNISGGKIEAATHDSKYLIKSMGSKTLTLIEKYEIDVLGEYRKVHLPEVRQRFR